MPTQPDTLAVQADAAELVTARELLITAREHHDAVAQAERDLLRSAAAFCELFATAPVTEVEFVAALKDPMGPCPIQLAGTGAPAVTDFAVAEFAATMSWSLVRTRDYLGQALELRHRLPLCWARIQADDAPAWKARQIAEQTKLFSPTVARYVDRALFRDLATSSPGKIRDTIAAALLVVDEDAEITRVTRLGNRYVLIGSRPTANSETTLVDASLDLADAKDLEAAVNQAVADLGLETHTTQLHGVARAQALGHIARSYLTNSADSGADPATCRGTGKRSGRAARTVNLFVHLNPATFGGDAAACGLAMLSSGFHVGVDQVEEWCQASHTRVIVRPVIDLNQPESTSKYTPTARIKEHVQLRDPVCVFPGCNRASRQCDLDHVVPYDPGGPPDQTSTTNLQPLCRTHHRVKTHAKWTSRTNPNGTTTWRSPRGITYTGNKIIA